MIALSDTYLGALDRDGADVPPDSRLVGVPAGSSRRLRATADELRPALALPPALLDDHADAAVAFRVDGLCKSGAHNAAWDCVDFAERYRDHLATDADARTAIDAVRGGLAAGVNVVLVGPDPVRELRSHRTVLRAVIVSAGDEGPERGSETAE